MTSACSSDSANPDFVTYKRHAAQALIKRGYSIAWSPDDALWFDVYMENPHGVQETRAEVVLAVPANAGCSAADASNS